MCAPRPDSRTEYSLFKDLSQSAWYASVRSWHELVEFAKSAVADTRTCHTIIPA